DDQPLLAYKGRVVGINAYVGDYDPQWAGDYARVIVNAGRWLRVSPCPTFTLTPTVTRTPTITPTPTNSPSMMPTDTWVPTLTVTTRPTFTPRPTPTPCVNSAPFQDLSAGASSY